MYTPKGFKNEVKELFDDLAETAISYGFKNEAVRSINSLSDTLATSLDLPEEVKTEMKEMQLPEENSEMHSELVKKVDFFFNSLDQKLYNIEAIKKVKQNISAKLLEYADLEFELKKESLNLRTKEHAGWLCYGFSKGVVISGAVPAVVLSFIYPPLIPVCALSGFWGGIWCADTEDNKRTAKYDHLNKIKKELIDGVLNV